jgi:hypothetical protein
VSDGLRTVLHSAPAHSSADRSDEANTVGDGDVAISEHDRYELHKWLVDNAGEQVAETLMAHLPPGGWAEVATKRDLEQLDSRFTANLRAEIQGLRAEFHDTLRVHLMVILGFNLSLFGAAAALLR